MDQLADILQSVGYHAAICQPLLPMYLHLILSATFPIYTGAHASLTRPSSAAKPSKKTKWRGEDDEDDEEVEHKMEGLSPMDAIMLPILGGLTLAGLYYLIKWLEDPAILNKVLNWYFSVFGALSLARLLTDSMGTLTPFIFPDTYSSRGRFWKVNSKERKASSSSSEARDSPLPGILSILPLPSLVKKLLWTLRELSSRKIRVRAYVHNMMSASFKIGPQGITGLLLALIAELWTGTLILGALFVYDIYFVFFTPLMVTVATQLDIPAKLLFPRPSGPGEDPAKQAMSMLGLGDVVLPGMMIGFALRFDLYLFYLRKQKTRATTNNTAATSNADTDEPKKPKETSDIVKAEWSPAIGRWGDRFWSSDTDALQGCIFPKTYFHASLIGYVVGMLFTLGVMQVYGHAQPALLYLVPGTLGMLWGTALIKGDIKTMWTYTEADEEEKPLSKDNEKAGEWYEWTKSWFIEGVTTQPKEKSEATDGQPKGQRTTLKIKPEAQRPHKIDQIFTRDRKSELIFFSVDLPRKITEEASDQDKVDDGAAKRTRSRAEKSGASDDDAADEHVANRTRARAKKSESRSSVDPGETW
ncbi:hypothetical protein OEA41_005409 [Lepraria neglecta]|uniref:Peptidase A22B, signal peptide peptidase n=1 Tax=Lepraria neglecta TaxID=209136 RepID=A0AAD9YZT8_9LECA|nr:hypothetical protein OEA41_005409 [Lepraria neglecta]